MNFILYQLELLELLAEDEFKVQVCLLIDDN